MNPCGTIILVVVGIAIVRWIFEALGNASGGGSSSSGTSTSGAGLSFRGQVRQHPEQLEDGSSIEVLAFSMRGSITAPHDNYPTRIKVFGYDETDGEDNLNPILCVIDGLQATDSYFFEYLSHQTNLPHEHSLIEDWVPLFSVPIGALRFARKGDRELCFFINVVAARSLDRVLAGDMCQITVHSDELGFEDSQEIQLEMDRLTVQLAVAVSAADEELHPDEARVIQHWIKKRISLEGDDSASVDKVKRMLNGAVQTAHAAQHDDQWIVDVCTEIKDKGSMAHRYDALEFCLEVARADGSAEKEEFDIVNDIAKRLDIDMVRFREMLHKALPVDMHAHEAGSIDAEDAYLGIDASMSKKEIKELLKAEYRKWNQRVTHRDSAVQKQASEMLRRIGEARQRHAG